MKKVQNFPLSFRALTSAAVFSTVLLASLSAFAMRVDSSYDLIEYKDFAYNLGKYSAGAVNVSVYKRDGTTVDPIAIVPSFDSFGYASGSGNGGGSLSAPQYFSTAWHVNNGNAHSPGNAYFQLNDGSVVKYEVEGHSNVWNDGSTWRLKKIVTEVAYTPLCTDTALISGLRANQNQIYHIGTGQFYATGAINGSRPGTVTLETITSGNSMTLLTGTEALAGTMTSIFCSPMSGNGNYRIQVQLHANATNPLEHGTESGDSGSPLYVYNSETKRMEFIGVDSTGTGGSWSNYTNFEYNPTGIQNAFDTYDCDKVTTDSAAQAIVWNATTAGTLVQGEKTWNYHGNNGNIAASRGIVFTNNAAGTQEISLGGNVDMGVGSITFDKGNFTLTAGTTGATIVDSAGFIVNDGASVTTQIDGKSGSEWRKVGAGTLTIQGTGNHEITLNVGGGYYTYDENGGIIREKNETRLDREGGYAAKSFKLSAGVASIVLMRDGQIVGNGSNFTFGNAGGTLNLNGQNLSWNVINHMDSGAVIANKKLFDATDAPAESTFTYTGTGTFKGSFTDGQTVENGLLKVVYDNSTAGTKWTLTGVSDNKGGFVVENGSLVVAGTHTAHYKTTVWNDYTWAVLEAPVTVNNSGKFTLGVHAQMTGDVTVNGSGTFELQNTIQYADERMQGSEVQDVTNLDGLRGNVNLASTDAKMILNSGNANATTYTGNISGTGNLEKIGSGTFILSGTNTFLGTKNIAAGMLVLENAGSFGDTTQNKWLIGEQGILAVGEKAQMVISLDKIDSTSTGVLALSQNQTTALDASNHAGLFIGALAGTTVEYGTADQELAANNGEWRLGGGGGTLNVNFKLTGANTLVIGNEFSSGTVKLTNTENDFSGNIILGGENNFLTYDDIRALGTARIVVYYGNEVAVGNLSEKYLAMLGTGSTGVFSLAEIDGPVSIAINQNEGIFSTTTLGAANAEDGVRYTGTIAANETTGYSFGGNGKLILDTNLANASAMKIDGQGFSNGNIVFARENDFAGTITAGGKLDDNAQTGAIGIRVTTENALKKASQIELKNGATFYVEGTNAALDGKVVLSGTAKIANTTETAQTLTLGYAGDYSLASSALNGKIDFVKNGAGTLTLSGRSANRSGNFTINAGTVVASVRSGISSFGNQSADVITIAEGAKLELTLGASRGRNGSLDFSQGNIVQQLAGTGTVVVKGVETIFEQVILSEAIPIPIDISYKSATIALTRQATAFEGTVQLSGKTRLVLGSGSGNLTALGQKTTIVVDAGSQAMVTPNSSNSANNGSNAIYSDFEISGNGFAGSVSHNPSFQNYKPTNSESCNVGALSVDYGSTIYGNVTLKTDSTIASHTYSNNASNGGRLYGLILGEGKTLTLGGTQKLTLRADAANTYGALVINNGTGTVVLDNGAAQNTQSTALGKSSVTMNAGTALVFDNAGTDDKNVVYTYANAISANDGATIKSTHNTTKIAGTVSVAGTTLNLATANGSVLSLAGGISGTGKTVNVANGSIVEFGGAAESFSGMINAGTGSDLTLLASAASAFQNSDLNFTDTLTLSVEGTETFVVNSIAGTAGTLESTTLNLEFDFRNSLNNSALDVATLATDNIVVSLNLNEAGDLTKGTYTLVVDNMAGKTVALADGTNARASISINESGALILTVAGDGRLVWKNISSDTEWNTTSQHWSNDFSETVAFSADADVIFGSAGVAAGNSATARETVSLGAQLNAGTVLVKDGTFYTFDGAGGIGGENASLKVAGASLELKNSGTNIFAQGVFVSENVGVAGELIAAGTGVLTDSAVEIGNGGTLKITAANALAGTTKVSFNGGKLVYGSANVGDISSYLTTAGTGAVALDFAGQTNIALGDSTNLETANFAFTNSGTGTSAVALGSADKVFTFAAGSSLAIAENVSVSQFGAGTLGELSGAGNFALDGGTLTVAKHEAFFGALAVNGAGTVLTLGTKLGDNSTFATTVTGDGKLSLNLGGGNGTKVTGLDGFAGTLGVASGILTVNGSVFGSAKIEVAGGAAIAFSESATTDAAFTFSGESNIHANSEVEAVLSGSVSASGKIVKAGAGTLEISGKITAGTLDASAGTLILSGESEITTLNGLGATVNLVASGTYGTIENRASGGTVNFGDAENASAENIVVSTGNFRAGDAQGSSGDFVNIYKNATLKITGSGTNNSSSYDKNSLLLGEWDISTTMNLAGTLLAQNANLHSGDTGATVNVNGGTLAVKGISLSNVKNDKKQALSLNLSGDGKIILGDGGINANVAKNWTNSLGAGTLATSVDSTNIDVALNFTAKDAGTATTIDTTRYDFAEDGNSIARGTAATTIIFNESVIAEGNVRIAGTGTAVMNGAFVSAGTVSVEETGTLRLAGSTVLTNAIAVGAGATLDLSGTGEMVVTDFNRAVAINNGTVKIGKDYAFLLTGDDQTFGDAGTTVKLFDKGDGEMGTLVFDDGETTLTRENFRWNGFKLNERATVAFDQSAGTVTLTGSSALTLLWNGGNAGTWNKTDLNFVVDGSGDTTSNQKFYNYDSVIFATENANIALGESVEAASVMIDKNTTLTASANATLGVETLRVNAGATLTLGGQEYFTWTSAEVAEGATLDLGTGTGNYTKTVAGTGTVKITNTKTNDHGDFVVNIGGDFAGTLDITGTLNWDKLTVGENATLKLSRYDNDVGMWGGSAKTIANDIILGSDYWIRMEDGTSKALTVSGDIFGEGKTLTVGSTGSGGTSAATFSGAVNLGGLIVDQKSSSVTFSGDATIEELNVVSGTANFTGTTILGNATNEGTINISGTAELYGNADVTNIATTSGTTKLTGEKINVSEMISAKAGGNILIDSAGTITTKILRIHSSKEKTSEVLTIESGTINVTMNNTTQGNDQTSGLIIGHWGGGGSGTAIINGGTLNAMSTYTYVSCDSAGTLTLNGGTLNTYGMALGGGLGGNAKTNTAIVNLNSGGRLNLGAGGLTNNATSGTKTFNLSGGTLGAIGNDWTSSVAMNLSGKSTINTEDASSAGTARKITLLGTLSGTGSLTKTGVGDLTLSGQNTFSSGVSVLEGALVAAHAEALGAGAVAVKSGAELRIDGATVTFSSAAQSLSLFVDTAQIEKSGAAGTALVTTANSGKITLSDEALLYVSVSKTLRDMFNSMPQNESVSLRLASEVAMDYAGEVRVGWWDEIDNSQWHDLAYQHVALEGGLLTMSVPEPSMFGLLAGLSALVLAGTRRRRKTKTISVYS